MQLLEQLVEDFPAEQAQQFLELFIEEFPWELELLIFES